MLLTMTSRKQSANKKCNNFKSRLFPIEDNQPVMSKFFSPKHLPKNTILDNNKTDSDIVIINEQEEQGLTLFKRRKTKESAPSPKRQRTDASCSESGTSIQTENEECSISTRVKLKLQSYSASNELDQSQKRDPNSFDFTVLKSKALIADHDRDDNVSIPEEGFNFNDVIASDNLVDLTDDDIGTSEIIGSKLNKFASRKQSEKGTKTKDTGKKLSVKYTPLEQQVIEFKEKYKDTVLLIECGYKFRFFGQDAEIAAKVLKIFAHLDHNFLTASIPVFRLFAHVKRLVTAGYKVGIVRQTETAALKAAGSNRNTPFTRQLTALYTKSTLIGEDVEQTSVADGDSVESVGTCSGYLMSLCEQDPPKGDKGTQIGIIAVQASTGEVVYDSFIDNGQRSELETRVFHLQPVEVIVPSDISMATEKLLNGIQTVSTQGDDKMRIERTDSEIYIYKNAFAKVSQFYRNQKEAHNLQFVINLPQCVIRCLAALISYLDNFKLEKTLTDVSVFSQFTTASSYMQIDSCTLRNLEIFQNATDLKEQGSLFMVLNQTVTPGGARLLKSWLSKPLLSHRDILLRQDAIFDIINGKFPDLQKLRTMLSRLPDLERRLTAAYYQRCSPSDFCSMCEALLNVCEKIQLQNEAASCHVTSKMLLCILNELPKLLSDVKDILNMIDGKAAKANDKTGMFVDESAFPGVCECKEQVKAITQEIQDHRRYVRLTTKQPSLEYTAVQGTEFLIEVKNTSLSFVPKDWTKISSTKTVSRFHSPLIVEKYKLLQQAREQLLIESNKAWIQFLDEFSTRYQRYRKAVRHLSTLDCLCSLAVVAQQHEYIRPDLVEDKVCIEVEGGRHPVVQQLLDADRQYVANDTRLNIEGEHVMVITGPNMGGKSCYIRQVALICILAQTGSYIPAQAARLGLLDAIYTRMGAADNIFKGRSTFMVELQEAAEIMKKATTRSLVILDELGRGTSTHDGVAIAHATLDFFISKPKCLTLFVTHYPSLAEFETRYPGVVGNFHMAFLLNEEVTDADSDCQDQLTFLYELVKGVAGRSYGLNVARLANIPDAIIRQAAGRSREMEDSEVQQRRKHELFQKLCTCEDTAILKQYLEHYDKLSFC